MEDEGSGDEDLSLLISPSVYAMGAAGDSPGETGVLDLRALRLTNFSPTPEDGAGKAAGAQRMGLAGQSFVRTAARSSDVREHRNSVGPWSDEAASPVASAGNSAPLGGPHKLAATPRQVAPSATKERAPARRPKSATQPRSAKRQAAPRPVSATTRPTSRHRPASAKRGAAEEDDEQELLSSANIAAARYYAGLGESSARKRLVVGDSYLGDRERDTLVQESPARDQKVHRSTTSTPEWTPSRRHLRSQPRMEECRMETPTGFCAYRIPGFSQRLTQTEKMPSKSLLQKVLERGGGSALSFEGSSADAISPGRATQPWADQDGTQVVRMGKHATEGRHSSSDDFRERENARRKPALSTSRTRDEAAVQSPRFPYYKDRNKGKEKDGEQVGLKVMPLRVPANFRIPDPQTQRSGQRRPISAGFSRKGNNGKTVHIERRPLSAFVGDIPSPPVSKKKGAITIAELDRQLRLLEIQAKAAEMGGPPLKIGAQTQEDDYHGDYHGFDAVGPELIRRGSGRMFLQPPPMIGLQQSPLATPRDRGLAARGTDTPIRSVGRQGSRGSLLSRRGLGAEMDGDVPFEVWSFQGKLQSYRRPDGYGMAGEAGKDRDLMHERHFGFVKSLAHAPAHSVLKGTGGAPSFVNTRFADQSIFVRGNSLFHIVEDYGNFLSASDLALLREEKEAPDRALVAAVEAGDELGQSLKERMVEPSLLQQMEQHCHVVQEFLWSLLDHMDISGYEDAQEFLHVWDSKPSEADAAENGAGGRKSPHQAEADRGDGPTSFSPVPGLVRKEICEDVWVAIAEKNEYLRSGLLPQFIPDLIPENMEYDEQRPVSTLLRLVLNRSAERWWENDLVVQQFQKVCGSILERGKEWGRLKQGGKRNRSMLIGILSQAPPSSETGICLISFVPSSGRTLRKLQRNFCPTTSKIPKCGSRCYAK